MTDETLTPHHFGKRGAINPVCDQASDWFARLQSPNATCEDRAAFADWLVADSAHEAAYFHLESLWHELERLDDCAEVAKSFAYVEQLRRDKRRKGTPLYSLRRYAIAASLVATALAIAIISVFPDAQTYQTALGEQRIISLEDGSTVLLDTLTAIEINYSADARLVELQRGQASFKVQKDPGRPFMVVAAAGKVEALGTRFDVYRQREDVTVTLLEGDVAVHAEAVFGAHAQVARLKPGDQINYGKRGLDAATAVDIERATAWHDRRLDFADTPLAEVVREINRYSNTKVELGDKSLESLRISGVFDADNSENIVAAVQLYFDVQVFRNERLIVIKQKTPVPDA